MTDRRPDWLSPVTKLLDDQRLEAFRKLSESWSEEWDEEFRTASTALWEAIRTDVLTAQMARAHANMES